MQEKAKLKLNTYKIVQNAVETGMKFALNRLEDTTYEPITEFHKTSALPGMVDEIMLALDEVVDWGD